MSVSTAPTASPMDSALSAFSPAWRRTLHSVTAARRHGLYHYLQTATRREGPVVEMGGRDLLNLTSNDYLGLAGHPEVVGGAIDAARRYGAGATASPLVSGLSPIHAELEGRLCALTRQEAAMLFPSGYQGNLAVVSTMVGPGDTVVIDRLAHASIIDGCRLSGARSVAFRHNDCDNLRHHLSRVKGRCLVVVESIYSMDGDGPDLRRICEVAESRGALVMVDEAHAVGFQDESGSGAVVAQGVHDRVGIVFGTLGKALGSQGSFVAGRRELVDYLRHKARPYIFSTGLSPTAAGAALAALNVIAREPARIAHLWAMTEILHRSLRAAGCDIGLTRSPITPLLPQERNLLGALRITRMVAALQCRGVLPQMIVPPAVGLDQSRLRLVLRADLSLQQVHEAAASVVEAAKEVEIL